MGAFALIGLLSLVLLFFVAGKGRALDVRYRVSNVSIR